MFFMKMYIVALALILAAVLPVAIAQEQTAPADPVLAPAVQTAPCPSPAVVRKVAAKKVALAPKVLPWWQDMEKANLAVLLLAVFLFGIIVGRLFAPRQPQMPQVVTPVVYVHPPNPPQQPAGP